VNIAQAIQILRKIPLDRSGRIAFALQDVFDNDPEVAELLIQVGELSRRDVDILALGMLVGIRRIKRMWDEEDEDT
jgi:hypothetical protein